MTRAPVPTLDLDLAIVGGGLGGALAAALVADVDRPVRAALFEASRDPGGRAGTDRVGPGHAWALNRGPRAVYRAGELAACLARLGVVVPGRSPAFSGWLATRDGLVPMPSTPGAFLGGAYLRGLERLAFLRALRRVEGARGEELRSLRWDRWLDEEAGATGRVAELLTALARLSTYDGDPGLSAEVATEQLRRALRGVRYLDGGWQRLVQALLERAVPRVALHVGQRVAALARDGERWALLDDTGDRLGRAEQVVLCLPRPAALALLRRSDLPKALAAAQPDVDDDVEAACLDLALDHLPLPRRLFTLGVAEPLYLSVHSATARLAPTGGAVLHAMRYGTSARARDQLERLVDEVQPGWREHVVHARFLPRMKVSGWRTSAERGGLHGRPAGELAPGLYAAGDWVGPRGMLADAVAASAEVAVAAVLGERGGARRSPVDEVGRAA